MDEATNFEVENTNPPVDQSSGEPAPGTVNEPPDPLSLAPEVERLKEERIKRLQEQERYWRDEARRARADYFRDGRGNAPAPAAPRVEAPLPPTIGPAPQKEQFNSYDDWIEAKIAFENKKARWQMEVERAQTQAHTSATERMEKLRSRLDEGAAQYADFEDVALDEALPVDQIMADALAEAENPAAVLYHLGKNRSLASKISQLPVARKIKELYALDQQLKNQPKQKITGAPPPINPVGNANQVGKDLDKMSQKEFAAEMERRTGYRY